MTDDSRNAIFISHANPEDNAFTVWLGARLTAAGYEVWADVLRLRGGQDWQRRLEDALRDKACKVLLVGTAHGTQKQGIRNEIQIAHDVSRRIGDTDFIIPLRLTDFDAPFLIAHAQYIDFKQSWADGLAELLETLDQTYQIPHNHDASAETLSYWKEVHLRHAKTLAPQPEPLMTNWLSVEEFPERLLFYDFRPGISLSASEQQKRTARWPLVSFRRGFLAFCAPHDLQDHFGPSLPLLVVDEIDTGAFFDEGWPEQRIERFDARNQFSDLVRQAIELTFSERSLSAYKMASEQYAWWGSIDAVPETQISFDWQNGWSGRRKIIGYSRKRALYWHFGVTPRPFVLPFPHIRLIGRVIFSEDGHKPLGDPKQMHQLRRSFTRSWRNARWRDMLLAFLHWLSDGQETLAVGVGSEVTLTLRLPPETFTAPMSIITDEDQKEPMDVSDDLDDDLGAVDINIDDDELLEADNQDDEKTDSDVLGGDGDR